MSKETKPRKPRSTKKSTSELEAKIAELEAKLGQLSSQVKPAEQHARPSETRPVPPPAPKPRPAASGPTHGTLPAGMAPPPKPKEVPASSTSSESSGEVAPAYATTSSTGYTGNKYFATRARLSYHPPNKQFKGEPATQTSKSSSPPAPEPQYTYQETLSSQKSKPSSSTWKAKGAQAAEEYTLQTQPSRHEETRPAPPPAPKPRPAASGPTHGTLPAGMAPPKPTIAETAKQVSSTQERAVGEVAPAYATTSSTGYTGNKYFATRARLSYHPPNKQFKGEPGTQTVQVAPEPPKQKRGTLPAGWKP
ncbi:MAG: hypothetical protein ACREAD_04790 [Nitrosopumilaceae archaeon]